MPAISGHRRQRAREREREPDRMAAAARAYGAAGWPCVPGSPAGTDRACSCDRMGCPAPGEHPVSAGWARLASVDADVIDGLWAKRPDANVILPTGRVFDVFDVPAAAGALALAALDASGVASGPVAAIADERYLFFVATRGAPVDEDEWWSSSLDCSPETVAETPGLRWHCRDSYVVAPPSLLPYGREVAWVRAPDGRGLPDPLRLLAVLSDACEDPGVSAGR
ncbi:bifunctional DNA primase/polymerase [Actinomadura rayongensis]|uniref:DNA primase n=1 Tax=Actinomadura rayongensis TaxID=1429076 RepID=A0A6I4VX13_9ACTN|nr:bifunctional DNA primase/polymerase [Actinomadura rayongensis]MXQ62477.1 DNA primase [Actinomadura rayongensis]